MPTIDYDEYLSIENLEAGLRERTVRGGVYTMAAQGCKVVLQLSSTILLARLLVPEDFGLVVMVTSVTGILDMLKDLGLSVATVQRQKLSHKQMSTAFWINAGLGALLMLIAMACAPLLAWFYGKPQLVGIAVALSLTQLIGGLGMQHWALLKRKMRFKAIAGLEIAAWVFALSLAAVLALLGAGYWALVAIHLGYAFFLAAGSFFLSPWRPGPPERGVGARSLLAFGSNVMGWQFSNYFTRNTDNLLIGWRWGEAALGYYTKAYNLLMMPLRQINYPMGDVMIPGLSRAQDNPQRFRALYLEALFFISFFTLPAAALLIILAQEVVLLVLGDQWVPAIRIFRLLGIATLVEPIVHTVTWLYISRGRGAGLLRWSVFSTLCAVAAYAVGLRWGAHGVAAAYSVVLLSLTVPALYFATRGTAIRMIDVFRSLGPIAGGTLLAASAAWGIRTVCAAHLSSGLTLAATLATMAVVYVTTVFFLFGKKAVFVAVAREFLAGWREKAVQPQS
ncbi:lipopolysaccharide biosynthesis protein [Candidatus Sumerlaeota bacterium]|nr:lipopolysaccharide biosynthesis protein [Candidatus Sumerlaeota bacterium]